MTHDLKIYPWYFSQVKSGDKTFEVRINDRQFQKGDSVNLNEYDPSSDKFTGNSVKAEIGYVYSGDGIKEGFVVFSLLKVK